jgi:hypothetical protein
MRRRSVTKEVSLTSTTELILRGRKVRVYADGFVSLNDLHSLSGLRKKKVPYEWSRLDSTHALIVALHERITGKSRNSSFRTSLVLRSASGANGGIWAHPVLAAAYAGYLKPELEIEMREVWLRYQAGDATLADEVLERATDEGNEWAAVRALSRTKRRKYTATLSEHGVTGPGYGRCTNEVYQSLFDATAKKLKEGRGVSENANLRDQLDTNELVYVMAAEALATERIQEEKPFGNDPCAKATRRSSDRIREAIEADRKDRQQRLV